MIRANIHNNNFNSLANSVLLTNKIGGFFLFAPENLTKYSGLFYRENNEVFKTLDYIGTDEKIKEIFFNGYEIKINYENCEQRLFFPKYKNALICESDSDKEVFFVFDCRFAYDMSVWGRFYEISLQDNVILIKYSKKYDGRENSSKDYEIYTAIASYDLNFKKIGNWKQRNYYFDALRNDSSERWVYEAFSFKAKKFAVSSSLDKDKAIKNAKEGLTYSTKLKKETKLEFENFFEKRARSEFELAYKLSLKAVDSFCVLEDDYGIYAGLPWFFQFWTRDSALSSKALLISGNQEFIKKVLFRYLNFIRKDGLIPNILPNSGLDSIDSSGVVFFRLREMMKDNIFTNEEKKFIFHKLKKAIDGITEFHYSEEFVCNNAFESWMDTVERKGARIEINALQFSLYSFLRELAKYFNDSKTEKIFLIKEKQLAKKIRENFFIEGNLYDGIGDRIIRPNVFLAHYFAPELLTKEEWESVFDKTLDRLWLNWGGLSTIEHTSQNFFCRHTGVNNLSYHNGDSWFFLNNLSAICMNKLNSRKYENYIKKILEASTYEILHSGIFGFHSELSSACQLESNGCLAQAWSSALYIELINEFFG